MADLTFEQIFGNRSQYDNIDEVSDSHKIGIDIRDFQNVSDGGEIQNDLGISDLSTKYINFYQGEMGLQLFYAIVLLILQNQADNLNDDPTQKIFIQPPTVGLGVGSRTGQVRRTFIVNFFSEGNIEALADIDDL